MEGILGINESKKAGKESLKVANEYILYYPARKIIKV